VLNVGWCSHCAGVKYRRFRHDPPSNAHIEPPSSVRIPRKSVLFSSAHPNVRKSATPSSSKDLVSGNTWSSAFASLAK
jgi:hypothetical protein